MAPDVEPPKTNLDDANVRDAPQASSFQDVPWQWWDGIGGLAFLLPFRFLPLEWVMQLPLWGRWTVLYIVPVSWRFLYPLCLARWRLRTFRFSLPGPRAWAQEGLIALAIVGGLVAIQIALLLMLSGPDTRSMLPGNVASRPSTLSDVLLLLSTVTIGPVTEEIFFRGLIFNWLKRYCPMVLAMVLQAVFFGVLHPHLVFQMTVFGLFAAMIYEWRGTLLAPILFHAFKNAVALIALLLLA
jgi:membrane protease YdiL (CAAX protease family)